MELAVGNSIVENRLDVDGGDVIRQQDDLVCVYLVLVLVQEVFRLDEARLEKPRDERASSRKRIKHVYAPVADGRPKVLFEDALNRLHDEVHDRHWRIDDAKLLDRILEGDVEEVVVELNDYRLLLRGGRLVRCLVADGLVELLERIAVLAVDILIEARKERFKGLRNRVVADKLIVGEERIENRRGDELLREHRDGLVAGDGLVEVGLERLVELGEIILVRGILRVQKSRYALYLRLDDLGDFLRPHAPVLVFAAGLDEFRLDCLFVIVEALRVDGERGFFFVNAVAFAVSFAVPRSLSPSLLFLLGRLDANDVNLVVEGVECVVMRADCR